MKKFKKSTIVLLALAAVLLISSAVGSTRAALTYYSENYSAEVTVSNIGISLYENYEEDKEPVSYRNYLENGEWDEETGTLFTDIEDFALGKTYEEKLQVLNTGKIDTYVRVILTKTWIDENGKVDQKLDPNLIELTGLGDGWVIDEAASTDERTVLYYTSILAEDEMSSPFVKEFRVNPILQTKVIETKETTTSGTTIKYEYEYDGYTFNVEAEVDAVQTHNAADAIKSAWGVDVTVADNGDISLQ